MCYTIRRWCMVCRTFGAISLFFYSYWYSMDYTNIVCSIRISDYWILCLWNFCPIESVLSYWPLAQMNSVILTIQSSVLLYLLINYYGSYFIVIIFYCTYCWALFISHSNFGIFPWSCNLDIYALVLHNSSTFLTFSQTIREWNLCPIYPHFSCFILDVFGLVYYSYWYKIYDCWKRC